LTEKPFPAIIRASDPGQTPRIIKQVRGVNFGDGCHPQSPEFAEAILLQLDSFSAKQFVCQFMIEQKIYSGVQ
jgi:hypothetical protein